MIEKIEEYKRLNIWSLIENSKDNIISFKKNNEIYIVMEIDEFFNILQNE